MTRPWWRSWWRPFQVQVRRTCTLHDTPERIAVGAFCGLATAFLPIFGQMLLGMGLSWSLRGNILAAMPWTWITNPVTTPFIWFGCYRLGALLWPGHVAWGWERMRDALERLSQLGMHEAMTDGMRLLGSIYLPMLLGSVIVGLLSGAVGYILVRRGVAAVQWRRAQRAAAWRERLVPPGPAGTT